MTNLTSFEMFRIRLAGVIYALAYFAAHRGFLGLRWRGWLKWAIVIFTAVAWLGSWPRYWIVVGIALFVAVQLFFWVMRRRGYIRFLTTGKNHDQTVGDYLADNKKIKSRATGVFSVSRRQAYVLQKPADYWRVPIGDHAVMVEHEPGKFLYQFIQSGSLQAVETGFLIFGRQPQASLAITFLTNWGPEFGDNSPRQLMAGANAPPAMVERTIYLTFEAKEEHRLVRQNLMRDVNHARPELA